MNEDELKAKREEIEKGIRDLVKSCLICGAIGTEVNKAILDYLTSQGVEIIDRDAELPKNPYRLDYKELPNEFQFDNPTNEDVYLMTYNGIEKGKRLMINANFHRHYKLTED